MKTLYISDLDGTLLDSTGRLSNTTTTLLKDIIASGIHFTCATARTEATTSKILAEIPLSAPCILMNGVVILDLQKNHYIKVEYLDLDFYTALLNQLEALGLTSFIYTIEDNCLNTYYDTFPNEAMHAFFKERVNLYQKRYTSVPSLKNIPKQGVIYSLLLDKKTALQPLCDWISSIAKDYPIDYIFYPEIYYDDIWCLEIFSKNASKYNAVKYLKDTYQYDKVIGFGDNLNDLSLFMACDECYAVSNAKETVKQAATEVIGPNTEDSVPKKILALEKIV